MSREPFQDSSHALQYEKRLYTAVMTVSRFVHRSIPVAMHLLSDDVLDATLKMQRFVIGTETTVSECGRVASHQ